MLVLVPLLALGPACETYRATSALGLSNAWTESTRRVVFRPSGAPVEVTQAQFLSTMAWLAREVPPPSRRRAANGHVSLASWPSRSAGPPSVMTLAQADRCTGRHAVACLSLLGSGYSLNTPDARVDAAMAIALQSTLASLGGALLDMATLDELVKLVVGAVVVYLALALLPEPFTKLALLVVTGAVVAAMGWETYWSIVKGYGQLREEARGARDYEQVREAGARFGGVVGANAARVLVMLATTLLASGGANGSGGKLAGLLARLPGYATVAGRMEAAGVPVRAMLNGARSAVVTEEGVVLRMAMMEATADAEGVTAASNSNPGGAVRQAAAAAAGASVAMPPADGGGPERRKDEEKDSGRDALTEARLAQQTSFAEVENEVTDPAARVAGGWTKLSGVRLPETAPGGGDEGLWQAYRSYWTERLKALALQETKPPPPGEQVKPPLKWRAYQDADARWRQGLDFQNAVGARLAEEARLPLEEQQLLKSFQGEVDILQNLGVSKGKEVTTKFVDFFVYARRTLKTLELHAEAFSVKCRDLRSKTAKEVVDLIRKDYNDALKLYGGKLQIRRRGEVLGREVNVKKVHLVYSSELRPPPDVMKAVARELARVGIEVEWQ